MMCELVVGESWSVGHSQNCVAHTSSRLLKQTPTIYVGRIEQENQVSFVLLVK